MADDIEPVFVTPDVFGQYVDSDPIAGYTPADNTLLDSFSAALTSGPVASGGGGFFSGIGTALGSILGGAANGAQPYYGANASGVPASTGGSIVGMSPLTLILIVGALIFFLKEKK